MKKPRVIIADDDRDLVRALATRCRRMGLRVETAMDGFETEVELFLGGDDDCPDLIILDVNMPGDDGFSICEELFREERLSLIPVIILTGRTDKATIRRCEELGAHYVFKTENVWERIEPIIRELLDLEPKSPSAATDADRHARRKRPTIMPRVLWIDDDHDLVSAMQIRLKERGVDVIPAYSGLQGYLTALKEKPDLIVTDYVMREGYGSYIVRRLKQHSITTSIPIVVVTGRDLMYRPAREVDTGMERQFLRLGAQRVLMKPVDIEELLQCVRESVDWPIEAAGACAAR